MSDRPRLNPRQWWTLQSIIARLDCNPEADVVELEIDGPEMFKDLRFLALEGCICVSPGDGKKNTAHVADMRRGHRWALQWRHEQAAMAARAWELRPVPIRRSA